MQLNVSGKKKKKIHVIMFLGLSKQGHCLPLVVNLRPRKKFPGSILQLCFVSGFIHITALLYILLL